MGANEEKTAERAAERETERETDRQRERERERENVDLPPLLVEFASVICCFFTNEAVCVAVYGTVHAASLYSLDTLTNRTMPAPLQRQKGMVGC